MDLFVPIKIFCIWCFKLVFVLEMTKSVVAFRDCFAKAPKNEDSVQGACGTFGKNEEYISLDFF